LIGLLINTEVNLILLYSIFSFNIIKIFYDYSQGLLIDVSRHFIPIDQLKRQIAAMHAVKMNVLHLHLTDAQSFPILFDDVTLPTQYNISKNNLVNTEELFSDGKLLLSRLGMMGSFDSTKLYSKQDLSDLVQYSRKHNIDIIPEIDMPAHAKSWSHAFHNFIVNCSTIAQRAEVSDNIYPLDPTNELLYVVIAEIIKQITVIFPSQYIHVGGDEVGIYLN
jgi:hexosaminidase